MAMSRKHYEAIAKVISEHLGVYTYTPHGVRGDEEAQRVASVAEGLAAVFMEDNIGFDPARFFLACGLDEWGCLK